MRITKNDSDEISTPLLSFTLKFSINIIICNISVTIRLLLLLLLLILLISIISIIIIIAGLHYQVFLCVLMKCFYRDLLTQ